CQPRARRQYSPTQPQPLHGQLDGCPYLHQKRCKTQCRTHESRFSFPNRLLKNGGWLRCPKPASKITQCETAPSGAWTALPVTGFQQPLIAAPIPRPPREPAWFSTGSYPPAPKSSRLP